MTYQAILTPKIKKNNLFLVILYGFENLEGIYCDLLFIQNKVNNNSTLLFKCKNFIWS